MTSDISVKTWIITGLRVYRRQPGILLLTSMLPLVVLAPLYFPHGVLGRLFVWCVLTFIAPVILTGYQFLFLKAVRGQRPHILDLFAGFRRFGPVWWAAFLAQLLQTGGMLLLVIPGLIWMIKYMFSGLAALDQQLPAVEGIRLSARMTQGHKWQLAQGAAIGLLVGLPAVLAMWEPVASGAGMIDWSGMQGLRVGLSVLWGILVGPWFTAATAAAYESLREHADQKPHVVITGRTWLPAYIGGLLTFWNATSSFRMPQTAPPVGSPALDSSALESRSTP
jgi:hypothetical protein